MDKPEYRNQGSIISRHAPGERLHVGVAFDETNAASIVREMTWLVDRKPKPADYSRQEYASWASGGLFDKVTAERRKQIGQGHDAEHDDEHTRLELAMAAASYALPWHLRGSASELIVYGNDAKPEEWPFDRASWRPSPLDRKRELIKAMALLVAEYERLERQESREP